MNSERLDFDPEKMVEPFVDDDYDTRSGYDENFLGIPVPMPRVADASVVAEMEDGSGYVIPYEHFSVVVHKQRRLALLTAANVDGRPSAKEPEPGRDYSRRGLSGLGDHDFEKWVTEPRIDPSHQLPDKFYTKDRTNFDKGHIVRRDDVAWGADFDEVRRANGDTYHVTNCSPQVDAFNRSNRRGEWGKLENYVLKQAAAEKLCVFGGPVLDNENDKIFRGVDDDGEVVVQIPSLFWKVVVAKAGSELQTFAFLLEQDLSEADVEFNVDADWESKLISLSHLEDLVPDLEFPAELRESDQAEAAPGEEIRQAGGLARHTGPGGAAPAAAADSTEQDDQPVPVAAMAPPDETAPTPWSDDTSPTEMAAALAAGDRGRAGVLLDALVADLDTTGRRVGSDTAKRVLGDLKRYAWFDRLRQIAAAFDAHAQDDEQVVNHLAQARIELGDITAAVDSLLELRTRIETDLDAADLPEPRQQELEFQLGETVGLLGRAYKQYYVNARPSAKEPRRHDLDKALEYYGTAFDRRLGDYKWHGINYVALLTHKERIAGASHNAISDEAAERAQALLDAIDSQPELASWDLANRIEAHLARGETPDAIEATKAYLDVADAFNVQSTRRQLIDVWLLTEGQPPGSEILPMMNARMAELGGIPQAMTLDPAKAAHYEKVWGKTKYKSLRWLNDAFSRAMSVARVGANKYDGDGTGFLFDGSWISEEWAGRHLLLTNAHVCSNDPEVQEQYPYPEPHGALTAAFLGAGTASEAEELKFKDVVWSSKPSELDATLLELASPPPDGSQPLPKTDRTPPVTTKGDARLNILGYPKGLDLRISMQDNKTVGLEDRYIHYTTPTDPGSSGSPVFNQRWELVALHHASSTAKNANEGIRIDVIIDHIKAELL